MNDWTPTIFQSSMVASSQHTCVKRAPGSQQCIGGARIAGFAERSGSPATPWGGQGSQCAHWREYNAVMLRARLEITVKDREFSLVVGDITKIPADAIGNAANSQLAGGGGVDGAIHRAGGPAIMRELDQIRERIGRCPAGDAVATAAGNLSARWVFHAVGPVYRDGRHGEATALRSCYQRCLELADEVGARTLTLPAISTGVYGYPMDQAAEIAVSTVAGMLSAAETRVQRATFVLFDELAFREFATAALDIALPLRP